MASRAVATVLEPAGISDASVYEGVEDRPFPVHEIGLRDRDGAVIAGNARRWLGRATAADELVLDHAVAPVLDVGCGPGRHILALAGRGIAALGLDVTPSTVHLARLKGAVVVQRSIFEAVPGSGTWGTALLLDGNIGIGGDPVALLKRVGGVIRLGGRILVELGTPGGGDRVRRVRLDHDGRLGPWFDWATVDASSFEGIAAAAGMELSMTWRSGGRWFARVEATATPGCTD